MTVADAPIQAERALLGCCILEPERLAEVGALVSPEAFYRPDHGRLFALLQDMRAERTLIDLTTVTSRIIREGADRFGGLSYVHGHAEAAPTSAGARGYAAIVAAEYRRRRIVREARRLLERAEHGEPVETLAAALRGAADSLDVDEAVDAWTTYADATRLAVESFRDAQNGGASIGGPVPWARLRQVVPYIPTGELVVVGARPSQGKSALARQLAECAAEGGMHVAVFSMEMKQHKVAGLTLCAAAQVPVADAMAGRIGRDAWHRIETVQPQIAGLPIHICDAADLTADDVVARSRALAARLRASGDELRLIVVDYIQLLKRDASGNRSEASIVAAQTRALKVLSVELGVAVVALSQLNRNATDSEGRDGEPQTAHLRDSGGIEADAGIIMLVWRPDKGNADAVDDSMLVRVSKNRFGPVADVWLGWDGPAVSVLDDRPSQVPRIAWEAPE